MLVYGLVPFVKTTHARKDMCRKRTGRHRAKGGCDFWYGPGRLGTRAVLPEPPLFGRV